MPRRKRMSNESLLSFFRIGWRTLSNAHPNVTTGRVEIVVDGVVKHMSALEFWEKVVIEVEVKCKKRRIGTSKLPMLSYPPGDDQCSSSGNDSFRNIYGTYLHYLIVGRNEWLRYHELPEKSELIQILLYNVDNFNEVSKNLQMKLINALKASPSGRNIPICEKEKDPVEKDNLEMEITMETEPVLEDKIPSEELPKEQLKDTPSTSPDDSPSRGPEQTQFPDTPPLSTKESVSEDFTKTRVKSQKRMRRKRTPKVIKTSTDESSSITEEKRKSRRRSRREGRRVRQRYHRKHRYANLTSQTQTHVSILPENPENTGGQLVEWTFVDNVPVYGQIPAPTWTGYTVPEDHLIFAEGPFYTYDGQQLPIQSVYYPQQQFYPQNNYVYVPPELFFQHQSIQLLPYSIPEYQQPPEQQLVYAPQFQEVLQEQYPQQNLEPGLQEENLGAMEIISPELENNVALPPESNAGLNDEHSNEAEMLNIEEQIQELTICSGIEENGEYDSSVLQENDEYSEESQVDETESSNQEQKQDGSTLGPQVMQQLVYPPPFQAVLPEQYPRQNLEPCLEEENLGAVETTPELENNVVMPPESSSGIDSRIEENDEISMETQVDETEPNEQEQKEDGSIMGTNTKHDEEKRVTIDAEEIELLRNLIDENQDTPRKPIAEVEIFKNLDPIPPRISVSNNTPVDNEPRNMRQLSSTLRVSDPRVSMTYNARDRATQTIDDDEEFNSFDQATQTTELSRSLPTYADIVRKCSK